MGTHIDALSVLIDDLFELSRLEAGDISWSIEQVPLQELVGETVEAMRVQAEAKGVAVLAEVPTTLVPGPGQPREAPARAVQPDPERDPAHAGGRQRRRARRAGGEPGSSSRSPTPATGSAPEERDHVFTAFYRGGTDAARTQSGRRARARGLARDRRGARRPDLARRHHDRHPRALHPARRDLVQGQRGRRARPPPEGPLAAGELGRGRRARPPRRGKNSAGAGGLDRPGKDSAGAGVLEPEGASE